MANYRNGGYDKTARTWIGIIAVVLAVVIAGAIALGVVTEGFTDWSKFQPDKQEEQTDDGTESGFQVGEIASHGISLMSSSTITPNSEASVTLTATITPSNATDKTVAWSIAWEDGASSWASGKTVTDYVTVTPTSSGALTATVACKQAFGEPIVVTVTKEIESTNDLTASCTFQYAKRVTGVKMNWLSKTDTGLSFAMPNTKDSGNMTLTPTYSAYTIDDEFSVGTQYKSSNEFVTAAQDNGLTIASGKTSYSNFTLTNKAIGDILSHPLNLGSGVYTIYTQTGESWNRMVAALEDMNGGVLGTMKVTYTGEHSTSAFEIDFTMSASDLSIAATDITLNNGSYIF